MVESRLEVVKNTFQTNRIRRGGAGSKHSGSMSDYMRRSDIDESRYAREKYKVLTRLDLSLHLSPPGIPAERWGYLRLNGG